MAHRAGALSGTPGWCPVTILRTRLRQLPSHRRGGYQPPASERFLSVPLNGMQFVQTRRGRVSRPDFVAETGGETPPLQFIMVLCEFAQPGSPFLACTARAAGSRPYGGWAIVSAWHAKTLPGATQESRITHHPGAHWGSELRFKLQFFAFKNGRATPSGWLFLINGYPSGGIPRRQPGCRWR